MSSRNGDNHEVIRMATEPLARPAVAQVIWPAPGRPVHGIITQWPMHQLVIHWCEGSHTLCTVPFGKECKACRERLRPKWVGFVGAFDPGPGRHVIIEITSAAALSCPNLLIVNHSYVNYRLHSWRLGRARNSRACAELQGPLPGTQAPAPVDYASVIWRLYGLEGPPTFVKPFGEKGGEQ